jgi:hypothetical protein
VSLVIYLRAESVIEIEGLIVGCMELVFSNLLIYYHVYVLIVHLHHDPMPYTFCSPLSFAFSAAVSCFFFLILISPHPTQKNKLAADAPAPRKNIRVNA